MKGERSPGGLAPVLSLLSVALGDPVLRKIVLEWTSRALGNEIVSLRPKPSIIIEWKEGFEEWLREKGIEDAQVRYYRSLFKRYFEGEVLNEDLVERASKLELGWARVVFRHYLNWLLLERRADTEFVNWALAKVKGRKYKAKLKVHEVRVEDVKESLERLRVTELGLLYRLLLESGLRLAHAIELMRSWSPHEKALVEPLGRVEERLWCGKEHCRYWVGISRGRKRALWAFMSKELAEAMEGRKLDRSKVTKRAKALGAIEPSKLRKFSEQYMKEAFAKKASEIGESAETLMAFVQGRVGELKVSHLHYDNLLRKADLVYPEWLKWLRENLGVGEEGRG